MPDQNAGQKDDAATQLPHIDKVLPEDNVGEGLTDDERASREHAAQTDGARVDLGPADLERLSKK